MKEATWYWEYSCANNTSQGVGIKVLLSLLCLWIEAGTHNPIQLMLWKWVLWKYLDEGTISHRTRGSYSNLLLNKGLKSKPSERWTFWWRSSLSLTRLLGLYIPYPKMVWMPSLMINFLSMNMFAKCHGNLMNEQE